MRDGKVLTAPNLGTGDWAGFPLAAALRKTLGKPARLHNDADVQGLAAIKGKGLELVCTLGTGFGTAWFRDGELMPHMDLAHMTVHPKDDFDKYIGEKTRKKIGHKAWNKRIEKLIAMLALVFNYDRLYFGGGNSRRIKIRLPRNVVIVSNDAGMEGSAFVWLPAGKPAARPLKRRRQQAQQTGQQHHDQAQRQLPGDIAPERGGWRPVSAEAQVRQQPEMIGQGQQHHRQHQHQLGAQHAQIECGRRRRGRPARWWRH